MLADKKQLCFSIKMFEKQSCFKDMFFRLVEQMVESEGVTEQLKANNQMEWVARMNNIRNRVTEIVNNDIIYT